VATCSKIIVGLPRPLSRDRVAQQRIVPTARRFGGKIRPMRVFISYRRDDSTVTAALLLSQLTSRPEFADAFMDIDDIGYGDDFVAAIDSALRQADVVLVVIGPKWAEMLQARLRGDDWVRHEVATALKLRDAEARPGRSPLRVLPVLVGGASPPATAALPEDLAGLSRLGMLTFDERALKASITTLLESLRQQDYEGEVRKLQEERRKLEDDRLQLESERKRRVRVRITSVAIAFALFFAAISQLFAFIDLDEHVALATMLLARVGAPEPPWSGKVVLVGIDEESERAIGRKFHPNWRAEHAALIANAASAAARTVAFDMVLEDPASEPANAALEEAIKAAEKMPIVFVVQNPARSGPGVGEMLPRFAKLVRQSLGCLSLEGRQAIGIPLAVVRAGTTAASAPAPGASGSVAGVALPRVRAPLDGFALAAYTGGGRVELIDEEAQSVVVRPRQQPNAQSIDYYKARTLSDPQPGCDVLQPGDRVLRQLLDPYALPPLRTAPQRIAYERVVRGDPDALALLKDRVVIVGTLLAGSDRQPLPWPAADRWGVELFAAQADAMARDVAIVRLDPIAEWALMTGLALLGAACGHRLRDRPRVQRIAALAAIAVVCAAAGVAWYRFEHQLVAVPFDIAALLLGAWLANRTSRRSPA
jgi:CHASE2 domain-containing sensor protein